MNKRMKDFLEDIKALVMVGAVIVFGAERYFSV